MGRLEQVVAVLGDLQRGRADTPANQAGGGYPWWQGLQGFRIARGGLQFARLPTGLLVVHLGPLVAVHQVLRWRCHKAKPRCGQKGSLWRPALQWQGYPGAGLPEHQLPDRLRLECVGPLDRLHRDLRRRYLHAEPHWSTGGRLRWQGLRRPRSAAGRLQQGGLPPGLQVEQLGCLEHLQRQLRQRHPLPEPYAGGGGPAGRQGLRGQ